MRRTLLIGVGLVLLITVAVFTGCAKKEAKAVEFILNNGAEPESLDPHLISGVPEHRIYMALFEGLVTYDPKTSRAVPGLAESWEFSPDRTSITFKLRKTTWSDGTPITAQTVKDSWIRMLDPETAAPYAWFPAMFLKGAAEYNSGEAGPEALGVEVIDDYTLKVDLVGPLPYALDAFAHYSFAVVPLHAIEKYGNEWTRPENFVGNGPFVLEAWNPQEKITCVPNEKYWDRDAVRLDRVVFLPIDDNNTSYNMYLNGELDWQTTVPTDRIKEAQLRPDYHVNPQLATYYYIFNNEKKPLDDPRVRKALSMAVNRKELVERVTQAGQIPAYGIVPPMEGYPGIKGLGEDVERAKALLAEAGYPNGEGFPELTILYNTSEGHKKIAEFIQQQWKVNLGIEVKLMNQEWKTYLATRRAGDFEIARAGWVGDYQDPNTFLDMFVTGGDMNDAFYSNPEYDALIHKAATMEPGPERFDVLMQAEELLITQDHAIMPLYFYVTINLIDTDKWGGWYPNVMDIHPVKDIYLKQ